MIIENTNKIDSTTNNNNNNLFDRGVSSLETRARQLDRAGHAAMNRARMHIEDGVDHGANAACHLLGAAANSSFAALETLHGVGRTGIAGAHVVGAGGIGIAGAGVRAGEWLADLGRSIAAHVSRAFASLANSLGRLLGDRGTVTVRELEGDPSATRLSDRLFSAAGGQMDQAGVQAKVAWNSFQRAVAHAAGAGVNVAFVAGHVAAAAGKVAMAAAATGEAGVIELAEVGVRAAQLGLRAAEAGVEGARDLLVLSARISAATANALALPDKGDLKVETANAQKELDAAEGRLPGRQPAPWTGPGPAPWEAVAPAM